MDFRVSTGELVFDQPCHRNLFHRARWSRSWRLVCIASATPIEVALAWLLQRSPNIPLIPGTSSVETLRENLRAASLQLPSENDRHS